MKKLSTAAADRNRNFTQPELTIGLDLGDRWSWFCVLDESGQTLLEEKVATTGKALRARFGGMPRRRIALEIGTHSPWISRLLRELGHEVIVANARKVAGGPGLEFASVTNTVGCPILSRLLRKGGKHTLSETSS